jgi:predicted thioesterase
MGCEVEVEVKISEVDGRRIILDAEVRDAVEVVGRGQHQRYVIDVARRTRRIEEKRKLIESRV